MADKMFDELVKQGKPVGEIIGIDSFLVKVRGLQPTNVTPLSVSRMAAKATSTMSTKTTW